MKNLRIEEFLIWDGSLDKSNLKQIRVFDVVRDRTKEELQSFIDGGQMSWYTERAGGVLIESFRDRGNAELFLMALNNIQHMKPNRIGRNIDKRPRRRIERAKTQMFGSGIRYRFNEEGC